MSDVMAVLEANGEKLVCVDYDRPVWHSTKNRSLRATPNLDHFVVDGLLACLDFNTLNAFGIKQRFNSDDFKLVSAINELKEAREMLYTAKQITLSYFHDFDGDVQIHQDLARFKMPILKVVKISTEELYELSK